MIAVLTANPVCETRTKALIQDLVRRAVARMLDRQESDAPETDSAGHLAQLAHEKEQIIAAQRDRNWELSAQLAASVAPQNGLSSEDIAQPAVARQVLAVMRQLLELEDHVESHFEDPLHAGRELLQHHGIAPSRDALTAPLLLSEAIEKACEEATDEVEKKIRVVGKVALAYFGDISVASLTLEKSFELLHLLWMLPKGWGKSHGRNRYEKTGNVFNPVGETQQADAIDRDLIAAVLADETMSVPDKRRKLVNELTPNRAAIYRSRHDPSGHVLREIDRFLDVDGMRETLRPFYSHLGRPSIDPELIIRMLVIGYVMGIRSERRLCDEVHLNLAYRWFCRLGLEGRTPAGGRNIVP